MELYMKIVGYFLLLNFFGIVIRKFIKNNEYNWSQIYNFSALNRVDYIVMATSAIFLLALYFGSFL
jgi:hypothetical protein